MSDKPGSRLPTENPSPEGGWYVPGGAGQQGANEPTEPDVPLPKNTAPEQPGGWYVPADVRARQQAQEAAAKAAESAPSPAEEPVVAAGTEPVTAVAADAAPQPEATTAAASPADSNADEPEFDYANYVPGKGFMTPGEGGPASETEQTPAPTAEPAAAASAETPAPAEVSAIQPAGIQPSMNEPMAMPIASLRPAEGATGPAFKSISSNKPIIPASGSAAAASAQGESSPTGSQPPGEPQTLDDKFSNVEAEVQILRRKYRVGNMTADELRGSLRKLMVLDDSGNWWMIGMESNRWYKYDGTSWVQLDPPGHAGAEAPGPTVTTGVSGANIPLNPTPLPGGAPGSTANVGVFGLPRAVPVQDVDATMVGRSAAYLDDTLRNNEPPIDSQATVISPSARGADASAGLTIPSPAVSVPSPVPAIGQVAPDAGPIQPDYGERPTGLVGANRTQLSGCLVRGALLSTVVVLGCVLLVVVGAIGYYYSVINQYSTSIDALAQNVSNQAQTLRIFDASGKVIAEISDPNAGKRTLVKLDQIAPQLIDATISTEDSRFYETPGFDVVGIVRAVFQNLSAGGTVSGASSITQQLARSLVFDPSQVSSTQSGRKVIEVFVASEISRRYSKNQILEMYLNQIPYGNFSNGIEAAAQAYFGKSAKNLNLAEAALLAGLPQAPSTYNPVVNREAAFKRMEDVLRLMVQTGCLNMQHAPYNTAPYCITQSDVNQAAVLIAQVKARTYTAPSNQYTYPHFVNYVLAELESRYGAQNLYKLGYNVYTTIDPNLQNAAEASIKNQVNALRANRVTNGAAFAINPNSGAILVMVGSADYNNKDIAGQYNVVLANRQPGSSIKPFVYATALEKTSDGSYWTPATIIWDVPTDFNGYRPVNYDGRFHGPQPLRAALANSYNIPAVRTMDYIGLDRFKNMAARVGLTFPLTQPEQAGLQLALGGIEVRMYDMVKGYAVFANGGQRLDSAYAIQRITKPNGGQEEVIFDAAQTPVAKSQVVDPALTYLMSSILSDNQARCPAFGCPNVLQLGDGRPVAVKTGTTNDYKDNWTIGYTPDVVVGVWVGNSDGTPMLNVSGITGAAPVWNQVMTAATRGTAIKPFPVPPGVAQAQVCADFGVAADFAECPANNRKNELFMQANPPVPSTSIIKVVAVDTFSGLVANENCPDFKVSRTFLAGIDNYVANWLNSTAAGQTWAQSHNLTLPISAPPTAACDVNTPRPQVAIQQPQGGQQVSSLIQIFGNVSVPNFSRYQIELSRAAQPDVAVPLGDAIFAERPTPGSFLGSWDTNNVPDGQYNLRIKFFDKQNRFAVVSVPVIVNNTNPQPQFQPTTNGIPTAIPFNQQPTEIAPLIVPTLSGPVGPTPTRPLFPPTPTRATG